jgi:excisionase family DNA binding protein
VKPEVQPRSFDKNGAARYLGVSRRTIERYIEHGQLKTRRIELPGNSKEFLQKVLIERTELDKLVDRGLEL